MKYTVHVGTTPIVLEHDNVDSTINVDSLTTIDISNIFGEAITVAPAANRIGMLKAEVEQTWSNKKLDLKLLENEIRNKCRKDAAENGGFFTIRVGNEDVKTKLTEKALETVQESNQEWIDLRREVITAERNVGLLSSLYWAIQDKSRKLNNLTMNVTPQEFIHELVEGRLNGILIKKK